MVLTEVKVVPLKKSHQIYISWEMTPHLWVVRNKLVSVVGVNPPQLI